MQQLRFFVSLLTIVAIISPLYGEWMSFVGDVDIFMNETAWKCDKIFCPPETHSCRVTKEKLEPNGTQVKRLNYCYDSNNVVLLRGLTYDSIDASETLSLTLNTFRTDGTWFSVSSSNSIETGCLSADDN